MASIRWETLRSRISPSTRRKPVDQLALDQLAIGIARQRIDDEHLVVVACRDAAWTGSRPGSLAAARSNAAPRTPRLPRRASGRAIRPRRLRRWPHARPTRLRPRKDRPWRRRERSCPSCARRSSRTHPRARRCRLDKSSRRSADRRFARPRRCPAILVLPTPGVRALIAPTSPAGSGRSSPSTIWTRTCGRGRPTELP